MGRMVVVTLNVKGLGAGWFDGRAEAVIRGLARHGVDVLALQEATIRYGSGCDNEPHLYNQARAVGDALGLHACAFAPYGNQVEVMAPEQGGLALLSRYPLRSVRTRRLPHGIGDDARIALVAALDTPFGELEVVNTHLSWRPEEAEVRLVQLGLVLQECGAAPWQQGPVAVLAGDLNATEEEPAIALARQQMQDAWRALHPDAPGHTWARRNGLNRHPEMGDRRLDYLFCSREVRVLQADVILDQPDPVWPSDHFGVRVELAFGPGA